MGRPPQTSTYLGQTFLGLTHLHANGILHRDLKPSNVLICRDVCKLTDFGMSKASPKASGRFSWGMPVGSPGYTAPEIFEEQPHDKRCDYYSFGVLVAVAVTGGVAKHPSPQPPAVESRDWRHHIGKAWARMRLFLSAQVGDDDGPMMSLPLQATEFVFALTERNPADRDVALHMPFLVEILAVSSF